MSYQTPKVTIDLEEYNELVNFKKNTNKDEIQIAAKKIISLIIKKNGDLRSAIKELNDDGIFFTIKGENLADLNENDITIEIKNKIK